MAPHRKVSVMQMEMLLDFAESHRDLASGRYPGGHCLRVREEWEKLASQLNRLPQGSTKTGDQWRRYWIEFKAKTKAKAADSRRYASATGERHNKLVPLNFIERRVLAILGYVSLRRLPVVRQQTDIDSAVKAEATETPNCGLDPLSSPSLAPSPTATNHPMEVKKFEEVVTSPLELRSQIQTEAPSIEETQENRDDTSSQSSRTSSREDKCAERSPLPRQRSRSRSQYSQRKIRRHGGILRWAYELELQRTLAEERHAAGIEALVAIMKDIRNDIHKFVNRTP